MRRFGRSVKAFTLVELILVIVIIGILAAIIIPKFVSQADKAREASAKANLESLRNTLSAYMANGGTWPPDPGELEKALTTGDPPPLRAIPGNPFIADSAINAKFKPVTSAAGAPVVTDFDESTGWIYFRKEESGKTKFGEIYINSKETARQKW